jgi:UDP-N-acetylglucosamine acyltransferase
MVGSHIAHDCHVGNDVAMANNATLGGHVTVGDNVFFGGLCAVHQFARIGDGAMIAGVSGVRGDVIPFGYVTGQHAKLVGLNVVGMKRRGFTRADMHRLRTAQNELFADAGTFRERLEAAAAKYANDPLVGKVIAFIQEGGSRALVQPPRAGDPEAESGET